MAMMVMTVALVITQANKVLVIEDGDDGNDGGAKDHSGKQGTYLYASVNSNEYGTAILFGQDWFSPKRIPFCLTFYYSMFGNPRSDLNVVLDPGGNLEYYYVALLVNSTDIGDHADRWFRADVSITGNITKKASIAAHFSPGVGQSGIAIDDISVSDGICDCFNAQPELCDAWGRKGFCRTNPKWMAKYCRKSCGTCACRDYHPLCVEWAMKGRCQERDVAFTCPYNCSVCHCHDNFAVCPTLGGMGYCDKRREFMSVNCQKTCGLCVVMA
ncbi:uncharacterized protein LOC5505444 isoform X2 [Nematostella vectensis]|uniref:uncharacterized protein LOC5505444 isoform X2 n=1 Tax=Nematostella vectensis TaxID=45351 RepID=UPI0020779B6B|nr:uncharacterized protein LOC5505444 isoform X2 [Nematostella vectensis]